MLGRKRRQTRETPENLSKNIGKKGSFFRKIRTRKMMRVLPTRTRSDLGGHRRG